MSFLYFEDFPIGEIVEFGDRLCARRTTLSARVSRSRPKIGLVEFLFEVLNQHGATVMTQKNVAMIGRRAAAEAAR